MPIIHRQSGWKAARGGGAAVAAFGDAYGFGPVTVEWHSDDDGDIRVVGVDFPLQNRPATATSV